MTLGDPSLALSKEIGAFGLLRPKGHVEKRDDRLILLFAKLCLMFVSQDFGDTSAVWPHPHWPP